MITARLPAARRKLTGYGRHIASRTNAKTACRGNYRYSSYIVALSRYARAGDGYLYGEIRVTS